MTTELTAQPLSPNSQAFELVQRQAKALSASGLVPEAYKNNVPNCLIALETAYRIGASPMAVMQNLHVIHGRPSWSSQFIIAALNSCGRFSPLRFRMTADSCTCWAKDKEDGEVLEGPTVTLAMAKAEGWSTKNGSKWATMPELMLRYRAAAFFGRLFAPDVLMGMHAVEEVEDFAGGRNGASSTSVASIVNQAASESSRPARAVLEHVQPEIPAEAIEVAESFDTETGEVTQQPAVDSHPDNNF